MYRVNAAYTLLSWVLLLEPASENVGRNKWVSSLTVKIGVVGLNIYLNIGRVTPT